MIFPNKAITFQNCVLSKITVLLDELSLESKSVINLYRNVKKYFEDIDEFIVALEVLYLLDKIEYDSKWEVLRYVEKNKV